MKEVGKRQDTAQAKHKSPGTRAHRRRRLKVRRHICPSLSFGPCLPCLPHQHVPILRVTPPPCSPSPLCPALTSLESAAFLGFLEAQCLTVAFMPPEEEEVRREARREGGWVCAIRGTMGERAKGGGAREALCTEGLL